MHFELHRKGDPVSADFDNLFGDFGEAPESADLFDNEDPDEANRLRREAAKRANDIRDEAYKAVQRGTMDLETIIYLSNQKNFRPLGKMRVHRMLASRPGWDNTSAASALFHYRIGERDTVTSIRNNETKVNAVEDLLTSTSAKWLSRPEMPKGWPFFGKLTTVLATVNEGSGEDSPTDLSELDAVENEVEQASPPEGASPANDDRHRLSGGYSDEGEDNPDEKGHHAEETSFRSADKWRPWESAQEQNEGDGGDIDIENMLDSLSGDDGDDIEGLIQDSGF